MCIGAQFNYTSVNQCNDLWCLIAANYRNYFQHQTNLLKHISLFNKCTLWSFQNDIASTWKTFSLFSDHLSEVIIFFIHLTFDCILSFHYYFQELNNNTKFLLKFVQNSFFFLGECLNIGELTINLCWTFCPCFEHSRS